MGYVKAQKLEVIEQNCLEIWIHHIKMSKKHLVSEERKKFVSQCYRNFTVTVLPPILQVPILWLIPISITASPGIVKWWFKLIFLWKMIMFMFFCIFLYCWMYNYMYLCTNKGKNMTKITIRLMIPILQILQPATLTNFTQNWRKHCTG